MDEMKQFFSGEASNAEKSVTAETESKKPEKVQLTMLQEKIMDEAKPALMQLLDDPELQDKAWGALSDKFWKEVEELKVSSLTFATENPAVCIGASSVGVSVITVGIAAACGAPEDVALVTAVSIALSAALSGSAFILHRNGVNMTEFVNVASLTATVVGAGAFFLTVREIIRQIKKYMDSCEHPIVPEAKEAPTTLGFVAELSARVGVFAALIGLVCGDMKVLRQTVSSWRDIRWSFDFLSNTWKNSSLEDLGIGDLEKEIAEEEAQAIPEGMIATSTVLLYNVIDTARKIAKRRLEILDNITQVEEDNDAENYFGYYPFAKCSVMENGVDATECIQPNELFPDHWVTFLNCKKEHWATDGSAVGEMKALVKAGLVVCTKDNIVACDFKDDIFPGQKKCIVNFMSTAQQKPEKENKLLELAKMGEKIQQYVRDNKKSCIVAGFVFASICTAGVAGLMYQYSDQIKVSVLGTACEIATPMIEGPKPAWKQKPKNEGEEEKALPPLESAPGVDRSSFGFVHKKYEVELKKPCFCANRESLENHLMNAPPGAEMKLPNWDEVYRTQKSRRLIEQEMYAGLFAQYGAEGKHSQKNKSSGDRAKDNQRAHAKDVAEREWKEIRADIRDARTDFDREQVDDWIAQRDGVEDMMLELEKFGSGTQQQREMYDELDRQYRKLSWNIFNMYDMYVKTENVSKVSAEAKPVVKLSDAAKAAPLVEKPMIGFNLDTVLMRAEADRLNLPKEKPMDVPNPVPVWIQPAAPVKAEAVNPDSKGKEEAKPQPARSKNPRSGNKKKKGKKEKAEATPTTQLRELKDHIDRLEQQLSDAPKKKSFADVLKTPAPLKKEKAQKEKKKEAEKPKHPKKRDFVKHCFNCKRKDHIFADCPTLPKGWVKVPAAKWEAMSPAEKRRITAANRALLPPYKPQSLSKHKPMQGSARYHDNLIPIFNPNAGNTGVDKEFWGTMLCASQDKIQYVWITEHQLLPGVYYRGSDDKVYLLPKKEEWTTLGFGVISQCRIPKAKLKSLPSVPNLKVVGPQIGTGYSCLYIGLNPMTMQRESCDTPYSWSGKASDDVIHSASTANFSCGSFLYDSELEAVIASHHGTIGPDSKLGENNLCSPLKAMGPRQ